MHRTTATRDGTRHQTELVALETGRRVATGRPLDLDGTAVQPKLELRVNHWSAGWTRAHGIKSGSWDRKENQRSADTEATFDLVTGTLESKPVSDLFDLQRRFTALADAGGSLAFVRRSTDGGSLQLWHAGAPRTLELDQRFPSYDPASVQAVVAADGTAWLVLVVDPVNAEAVARKRADPEYLDVFRVATDGKAVRQARVLATKQRLRFGVVGERFWLIERNQGFERGGKALTLYELAVR
ncbi:MAG: hypothetical protein M3680_32855 [Myxococcota bacterium]|nr:hypothetical protein [Myxococcota bacterium]